MFSVSSQAFWFEAQRVLVPAGVEGSQTRVITMNVLAHPYQPREGYIFVGDTQASVMQRYPCTMVPEYEWVFGDWILSHP